MLGNTEGAKKDNPMLPVSMDIPFFICPVSCVPYFASFIGLSFFIPPSVFSCIYLSCNLCTMKKDNPEKQAT
jgi:hypothetical protein